MEHVNAIRVVHRLRPNVRRNRIFRDRTNPLDVFDDFDLYARLRFPRHGLLLIFEAFAADLDFLATRRGSVPASMQIMVALMFYASGTFQILLGDLFGISKSTVHRCIHRVSNIIMRRMDRYVGLGDQREANAMKQQFYTQSNFPNVFACVDCTHVRICAPVLNEHEYVNRKGYHSINTQIMCDADLMIVNCVVQWPGSVHDARILRQSLVFPAFQAVPPPLDGFILGDSGYMLTPWLLTPYHQPVERERQRFNNAHCSTRAAIERCNGVLKRRWHCLHTELRYSPRKACQIISACIVLHNMATLQRLPPPDDCCNACCNIDDHDVEDDIDVQQHLAPEYANGRAVRDRIARDFFR